LAIIQHAKELYPSVDEAANYKVYQDTLQNIQEYRVLHYDSINSTVNLKLFYSLNDKIVLLAD